MEGKVITLQRVAACRAKLDQVNKAVHRKQWQQAINLADEYSLLLKNIDAAEHSAGMHNELVQLDIYHRRTMRLFSSRIRAVHEDIQSLEAGQKAAQRSLAFAETIYGC